VPSPSNTRLHVFLATWQKLLQLSWDVLPHPQCTIRFLLFRFIQVSAEFPQWKKISILYRLQKAPLRVFRSEN